MRPARAAPAARTAIAAARGRLGGWPADAGSKDRQFFGQFGGTAFRAGCPCPASGTNQQFAVRPALLTMKLVNRHGGNVGRRDGFGNEATLAMNREPPLPGPLLHKFVEEREKRRGVVQERKARYQIRDSLKRRGGKEQAHSRAWKNSPCCCRRCAGPE